MPVIQGNEADPWLSLVWPQQAGNTILVSLNRFGKQLSGQRSIYKQHDHKKHKQALASGVGLHFQNL